MIDLYSVWVAVCNRLQDGGRYIWDECESLASAKSTCAKLNQKANETEIADYYNYSVHRLSEVRHLNGLSKYESPKNNN